MPTPQTPHSAQMPTQVCVRASKERLCFLNLKQLDFFVQKVNEIRGCLTPACGGRLVPISMSITGYGGAARITYACDGCNSQRATLETSKMDGRTSEVSRAVQVAFLISGCTYATYVKVLQHSLGMEAVREQTFQSTVKNMYPTVKNMVDEMCKQAMEEMKKMDQEKLGSWSRAVITADGAWMTRGHHSKNFTFGVRNYFTGALLLRKHLCQKGSTKIIREPLYLGTSKAAEGYAAKEVLLEAKRLGMNAEIMWQDGDSSSSNAVNYVYPEASIMICAGHSGRSHLKQLQTWAKRKSFSKELIQRYKDIVPEVEGEKAVTCHCPKKHSKNCGCLSDAFNKQSRNNYSLLLSNSQSAGELTRRLRELYHHAQDEHEWENDGKCGFHEATVCSCKQCKDPKKLECSGKAYHTRQKLTCPFHTLAYKAEIEHRASMAGSLIHPELKKGDSNLMEASHNVLIRFRNKHIHLDRLHYELSTDLGLLQANMTYQQKKEGCGSHWIPKLYERLKLPVVDGIQDKLERYVISRGRALKRMKEEKQKRKRIQRKIDRKAEQEARKQWSKKHGGDTYGEGYSSDSEEEKKPRKKKEESSQCKCGSTTHYRTTSKKCPYNKSITRGQSVHCKDQPLESEQLTVSKQFSKRGQSSREDNQLSSMDDEDISSCTCTCGSLRAHKTDCPLNPRNINKKNFPKDQSSQSSSQKEQHAKPGTTKKSAIQLGAYVALHRQHMKGRHLVCRVVQNNGHSYTLYCKRGTLAERIGSQGETLQPCSKRHTDIPLNQWRQSEVISHKTIDEKDLEECHCNLDRGSDIVCLEEGITEEQSVGSIHSALYSLSSSDVDTILKSADSDLRTIEQTIQPPIQQPVGWLSDAVIGASQLLLLQHFPKIAGLQPPSLQQTRAFQAHQNEFVQIINVRDCHWCVVSNVGCQDGTVNVYDTMYSSMSSTTASIAARLQITSLPKVTVNMVDVGMQSNGSDCGVLAIAISYDLCSGHDPRSVNYDSTKIRQHLLKCLKEVQFTRFPVRDNRTPAKAVKSTKVIELYCTCRLPDDEGLEYIQCNRCAEWFHPHCLDIPEEAVQSEEVIWMCKNCIKD